MNVVYDLRCDLEDDIIKASQVAKIIDSMKDTRVLDYTIEGDSDITLTVLTHPTYFYDIVSTLRQYADGSAITYEQREGYYNGCY